VSSNAQLKGFSSISDPGRLSVVVKTSTLKTIGGTSFLPILLVAIDCEKRVGYYRWIDKAVDVPTDKKTLKINFDQAEPLNSLNLLRSLEPYYRTFTAQLHDRNKLAFYTHLFSESYSCFTCYFKRTTICSSTWNALHSP